MPTVLDSIYAQTYQPDKVVLNLAFGEVIPDDVAFYLKEHDVEIYYTKDTKVYKKLIPTLNRYPDACVINIDDDCIYPEEMIEEFMSLHRKYPNFPISGNKLVMCGMKCHCGCASLTKYEYFGDRLNSIDDDLMAACPSDDMVFTYLATLNGHPYIHTKNEYFENLVSKELEYQSYSQVFVGPQDGITKTYIFMLQKYGSVPLQIGAYVNDQYFATLIDAIITSKLQFHEEESRQNADTRMRSTVAYRLGRAILHPNIANIKALFIKNK